MYKKVVKTEHNSYVYYYHNFKIEGRVRNICLGTNLKKANTLLKRILKERRKQINSLPGVVKRCRKATL